MNLKTFLILCALFLLGFGLVQADEGQGGATGVKRIGVEEYEKLRTDTNTILLDVRTPAEFEKGHIPKAVNLDINGGKFSEKLSALDTNKTYLVNCAVGMRSARACKKMEGMGFKHLYDLAPGFDGWKKAGKPVER